METETSEGRFLIRVERRWKLWIPIVLSVAYFAWVVLIATARVTIPGVDVSLWVFGGLALFVFLVLLELLFFVRLKPRVKKAPKVKKAAKRAAVAQAEPLESEPDVESLGEPGAVPAREAVDREDEIVLTTETHKGLRVIEISRPPKSQRRGALFAKAYVAIDDRFVLRVEDIVADREELALVR